MLELVMVAAMVNCPIVLDERIDLRGIVKYTVEHTIIVENTRGAFHWVNVFDNPIEAIVSIRSGKACVTASAASNFRVANRIATSFHL